MWIVFRQTLHFQCELKYPKIYPMILVLHHLKYLHTLEHFNYKISFLFLKMSHFRPLKCVLNFLNLEKLRFYLFFIPFNLQLKSDLVNFSLNDDLHVIQTHHEINYPDNFLLLLFESRFFFFYCYPSKSLTFIQEDLARLS